MNLKENIKSLIKASGLSNKEVVSLIDGLRKDYHDRKNVGDTNISKKDHAKTKALINNSIYTVSKDMKHVFFKGDWRRLRKDDLGYYIVYLGINIFVKFKRSTKSSTEKTDQKLK